MQSVPQFALRAIQPLYFLLHLRFPDSGMALQGLEWWFPGLYGTACRKPWPPNADPASLVLYADDTLLPFKPLCFP